MILVNVSGDRGDGKRVHLPEVVSADFARKLERELAEAMNARLSGDLVRAMRADLTRLERENAEHRLLYGNWVRMNVQGGV